MFPRNTRTKLQFIPNSLQNIKRRSNFYNIKKWNLIRLIQRSWSSPRNDTKKPKKKKKKRKKNGQKGEKRGGGAMMFFPFDANRILAWPSIGDRAWIKSAERSGQKAAVTIRVPICLHAETICSMANGRRGVPPIPWLPFALDGARNASCLTCRHRAN